MTSPLYSLEILKLAASIAVIEALDAPQVSVEKRSPVCGSRVRIDLNLDAQGRVAAIGVDLNACALGQASAALLATHARHKTASELAEARDALRDYLAGLSDSPGTWPGLEVFAPARVHTGRHAAILLAFDAAAEAAGRVRG